MARTKQTKKKISKKEAANFSDDAEEEVEAFDEVPSNTVTEQVVSRPLEMAQFQTKSKRAVPFQQQQQQQKQIAFPQQIASKAVFGKGGKGGKGGKFIDFEPPKISRFNKAKVNQKEYSWRNTGEIEDPVTEDQEEYLPKSKSKEYLTYENKALFLNDIVDNQLNLNELNQVNKKNFIKIFFLLVL